MPKRKKNKIQLNSVENLENIMQEVYNDANAQINDANRAINELVNSTTPEDVNDYAIIAKEKGNLIKIKDSATKIKLELAKLEADVIKSKGNAEEAVKTFAGPSKEDFKSVRELITRNSKDNNEPESYQIPE
jgi:hypothetical protein